MDDRCLTCVYAPKVFSLKLNRGMCLACAVAAWKAYQEGPQAPGDAWEWRWLGHSTVHTDNPAPESGS